MTIHSSEIISGNHVNDFSSSPKETNSTYKKTAGNTFGGGGTFEMKVLFDFGILCPT